MSDNIKVEPEATVFVLSGLLLVVVIGVSVGSVLLFVLFPLLVLLIRNALGRAPPPSQDGSTQATNP